MRKLNIIQKDYMRFLIKRKEFCKQGNLPSETQKSQGYSVNEISLVEQANELQRIMYASILVGYCMGKDKTFIVYEWK